MNTLPPPLPQHEHPAASGAGPSAGRGPWWLSAAGLVAAVALGAWAWTSRDTAEPAAPGLALGSLPPTAAGGPPAPPPAQLLEEIPGQPRRSVAELERRLFLEGSLRHVQPDGDWGADNRGQLRPSLALRRRFDQLLTTLGEANVGELGDLLRAQAQADLGKAGAEQVMTVWKQYLALLRHRYKTSLDGANTANAGSWQAALAERQQVRRELLGADWADAFYRDEEAALQARLGAASGNPQAADGASPAGEGQSALPALAQAPAPGTDLAALQQQRAQAFGAEAAQRLQAEDQAQAAWEARIATARAELQRLKVAPELSAPQRQQAAQQWLDAHFSGTDRLRAQALLGQ